jgi:alkylated DNA repair dioxygenase AlkB
MLKRTSARLFEEPASPLGPPAISGLSYLREYISEKQERDLTAEIDAEPWDTTWKRRRQLYGWSYDDPEHASRPIPPWGRDLAARMFRDGISDRPFDQMLVNQYLPGQGIALHRDYDPFDRTVVSLSLLSACVMDFRRLACGRRESMLLEPRSLLILSDDARYEWQHGIAARKTDKWQGARISRARRLSITFRLRKSTG